MKSIRLNSETDVFINIFTSTDYAKVGFLDETSKQRRKLSRVFQESSHYYLIYAQDPDNNNHRSVSLCVLAFMILVLQIFLNYIIIDEGYPIHPSHPGPE